MKKHWHEQIQRHLNGQSSVGEAAALQAALSEDAELRALYLDYMNLDVALGAAGEAATINENGTGRMATFPRPTAQSLPHYWPWIAATAACAASVVFAMLPKHRNASPARPDIAAIVSSTQGAIARFSLEPPSLFPAWASPTASLLEPPRIPQ